MFIIFKYSLSDWLYGHKNKKKVCFSKWLKWDQYKTGPNCFFLASNVTDPWI